MNATILLLSASLLGQAAGAVSKADEKLEHMKGVASSYRFALDGDRTGPLKLGFDPAFRMGKQAADDVLDGAIFFWSSETGRPEAALAGLPGEGLVRRRRTLGPGVHLALARDVHMRSGRQAKLGSSRAGSRVQTRARRHEAGRHACPAIPADAGPGPGVPRLRQLQGQGMVGAEAPARPPYARYGKAGSAVLEGAVFAFALGTDPEAFLFLETREGKSGLEWQYAFAPMGCFEMKGSHDGKVVWTVPLKKDAYDPLKTYYVRLD